MIMLESMLIALAVGGMVFIAGCGILDMADTALRALRRRERCRRERRPIGVSEFSQ